MILTDTHTHLYSEAFDTDRDEVINRAITQGVSRFFIPAIDASHTEAMLALEACYPSHVFLMMGLHPTSVTAETYLAELDHVEEMLAKRRFYAIGEIGIDLYWDTSTLALQKTVFKQQIRLAKHYQLPIAIHCRAAFDAVFEILEQEQDGSLSGVFHCFTGTLEQAKQAISHNMMLGIGGVSTFKNGKISDFLKTIDLKHIVLETDAPYLAPVPYRGKRNESAYLIPILEQVATIYGQSYEAIARITTQNSKTLFKI